MDHFEQRAREGGSGDGGTAAVRAAAEQAAHLVATGRTRWTGRRPTR